MGTVADIYIYVDVIPPAWRTFDCLQPFNAYGDLANCLSMSMLKDKNSSR